MFLNIDRKPKDKLAVVDNAGNRLTYGELCDHANSIGPKMDPRAMVFCLCKNEAGSLANAISIIGKYGYNMTALRSRPMKKHSWQYYFYVEIDGSVDTENGRCMLDALRKMCDHLKAAGSFAPHTEI